MNTKNVVTSVIVSIIVVVLGFTFFGGKTTERIIERLGVAAGPEHTQYQLFKAGYEWGGPWNATTTQGNATLQVSDLFSGTQGPLRGLYVRQNTAGGITLTLMASSTLGGLLNYPGATHEFLIKNATSTARMDLTLASGTGIDFEFATSSPTKLMIGPADTARISLVRNSTYDLTSPNDFTALFDLYEDAD